MKIMYSSGSKGEPGLPLYTTNNQHNSRRNSSNIFASYMSSRALILVVLALCVVASFYKYNETHSRLKAKEIECGRFQQQADSLSAQLQVVYEHKSRLEKSLQAEKDNCASAKDSLQKELKAVKDEQEAEKISAQNKYKTLEEQHKLSKDNEAALQEKFGNLQSQMNSLKDEKLAVENQKSEEVSQLKAQLASSESQYANLVKNLEQLRAEIQSLQTERDQNRNQVAELQSKLTQCSAQPPGLNLQQGVQTQSPVVQGHEAVVPLQEKPKEQLRQEVPAATPQAVLPPYHQVGGQNVNNSSEMGKVFQGEQRAAERMGKSPEANPLPPARVEENKSPVDVLEAPKKPDEKPEDVRNVGHLPEGVKNEEEIQRGGVEEVVERQVAKPLFAEEQLKRDAEKVAVFERKEEPAEEGYLPQGARVLKRPLEEEAGQQHQGGIPIPPKDGEDLNENVLRERPNNPEEDEQYRNIRDPDEEREEAEEAENPGRK